MMTMQQKLDRFEKLKNYCEKQGFKGWDPYDGLNSKIFRVSPFRYSKMFRLAWIQLIKKSPVNLRRLLIVRKGFNPKGLGLFLSGYCNLYKLNSDSACLDNIHFLIGKITEFQSKGYSGSCWGYNFDWQARAFFQPKGTPSVVVTSYIGGALLDAYEILKDDALLNMARSACDFILKDLNRTYDNDGDFSFSYCPLDRTQVFNASLLGARLLCRTYSYTKEELLISEARKAVSFACKHQQQDGAWAYSPLPFHSWIDNFHTGYNLECIFTYAVISGDNSFETHFNKGLEYYLNTFFEPSGLPRYYHNSRYPIDIHTPAQLVVSLSKMKLLPVYQEVADRVLRWTIENMSDEKKGFFYFQKGRQFITSIPYMRWSQAWMFFALSEYLLKTAADKYQANS